MDAYETFLKNPFGPTNQIHTAERNIQNYSEQLHQDVQKKTILEVDITDLDIRKLPTSHLSYKDQDLDSVLRYVPKEQTEHILQIWKTDYHSGNIDVLRRSDDLQRQDKVIKDYQSILCLQQKENEVLQESPVVSFKSIESSRTTIEHTEKGPTVKFTSIRI